MSLFSGIKNFVSNAFDSVKSVGKSVFDSVKSQWDWMSGISSATDFLSTKDANETSAKSAKERMQFEERMSNTAHQREILDLYKAGLNPILSAGGSGASTPSGAQFTAEAALPGRSYQAASSAKMARDLQVQQMAQSRAAVKQAMSASDLNVAQADKAQAEAEQTRVLTQLFPGKLRDLLAGIDLKEEQAGSARATTEFTEVRQRVEELTEQLTRLNLSEAEVRKLFYEGLGPLVELLKEKGIPALDRWLRQVSGDAPAPAGSNVETVPGKRWRQQ